MNTGISEHIKGKIIRTVEVVLPNAKIYLFGSRARGDFNERSDIDLLIDTGERIPGTSRGEIISLMDALSIIYSVDVVDYHSIPEKMKQKIDVEKIAWKN